MESTFDFNELTRLSRKIVRGGDGADMVMITLKDNGGYDFRISTAMAERMSLETNSLEVFQHPKDKTKAFIAVCPGNTGSLLKMREGKKGKGTTFRHNELAAFLKAGGFGDHFTLTSVGVNDGKEYFQIAGAGVPAEETTESEKPVKAKKTKEVSVN